MKLWNFRDMRFICSPVISLTVILLSAGTSLSKEWRGVLPLQSTRADVERLLGAPQQSSPSSFYYSLPDEIAVVWFEPQSCDNDPFGMGWNVPIGTVTEIAVIPKKNYRKEKFFKAGSFKVDDANAGFLYYTNESEGFSIETLNGKVTIFNYTPTQKEEARRCPRTQDCCVDFFPKFDEYESLSFEDEKARLDNYAYMIKEQMGRGVIVASGKNSFERRKLMKRAEQARQYLWQKHGIEPGRILIADGGYSAQATTELNVYSMSSVGGRVYLFPENDPEERNKKRP